MSLDFRILRLTLSLFSFRVFHAWSSVLSETVRDSSGHRAANHSEESFLYSRHPLAACARINALPFSISESYRTCGGRKLRVEINTAIVKSDMHPAEHEWALGQLVVSNLWANNITNKQLPWGKNRSGSSLAFLKHELFYHQKKSVRIGVTNFLIEVLVSNFHE